ncbi:MAG: hypothetical protein IK005_00370 [Paludibacteraceae bacterium]|nr:hypothetical protein [Paludibacteraceae bacterium]
MKKKNYMSAVFLLLSLILGITSSASSKDTRARLNVLAHPFDFYVAKNGNCYVVNGVGNVFKTNLSSSVWTDIMLKDEDNLFGPGLKTVYELQDSVLLLGGSFFQSGSISRSVDGGKSFDNDMTQTSYIDAMYSDGANRVWAVDIEQDLYYSADAGKTWTKKPIYTNKDLENRTSSIYFEADGKVGYITTHRNSILKTTDGGDSFTRIPTPGDQLPNKSKRYGASRVKCFVPVGKHYFVEQYGHIYMSGKDSICWQKVDSLKWIGRSSELGLFAITSSANVAFFDSDLNLKWMQKIPEPLVNEAMLPISGSTLSEENLKCVCDGQIYFLLTDSYDICSIGEKGVKMYRLYSDKTIEYSEENLRHSRIDTLKGKILKTDGRDVVCRTFSGSWYRLATLPRKMINVWTDKENYYVSDRYFNKYRVDCEQGTVEPYESSLAGLENLTVKEVVLETFIGGCYGTQSQGLVRYELNEKGDFERKIVDSYKTDWCNRVPEKLEKAGVDSLWAAVKKGLDGKPETIPFSVTEEDKKNYRGLVDKKLKEKREKENGVRDFFYSFADSINTLDAGAIANILSMGNPYVIDATGRRETTFVFKLSNGESLVVKNIKNFPNYLCSPWLAFYKGENFVVRSLRVGLWLDVVTKECFLPSKTKEQTMWQIAYYYWGKQ